MLKPKQELTTNRSNNEENKTFSASIIFNNLMGEGEKFFRENLFEKSIKSYTKALELYPENKVALAERACAHFKLGEYDLALLDADDSLKDNKDYVKALYIKAETLYAKGEFELALVFFHRCKRLRPDVKEHQIGIVKAQEAIENCVGDPEKIKLNLEGDLVMFNKPDENNQEKILIKNYKSGKMNKKQQLDLKREKRKADKPKTVKQLLGELYADKIFLEKILDDDIKKHEERELEARHHTTTHVSFKTTKKENQMNPLILLANDGLEYLDNRTEFWRQQKPLHRKNIDKNVKKPDPSKTALNYVLKNLEAIEILIANAKYLEAIEKSKKLLDYVEPLSKSKIAERDELIGTINSNMGNAFFELDKYDPALKAHQKDLNVSLQINNNDGISRAYENLGRVYARMSKYKEALEVWEKKIPLVESDQEKAWLFHEVGHCCLELKNFEKSKEFGLRSLDSAHKIDDEIWILNATVLIAQSELRSGGVENVKKAIYNFEKALKLTEEQKDIKAGNAIRKALDDCEKQLNKLKNEEEKETETETETDDERSKKTDDEYYYDDKQKPKENLPDIDEEDKMDKKDSPKEEEKPKMEEPTKLEDPPKKPEPEPIVKTDPQSPTEPIKQTDESNSDNPIKKVENIDSIVNYDIEVATGRDIGSGTDSAVTISIYGTKGEILNSHLSTSLNNKDPFERSQLDKFTIRNKSIGNINKINIGHDSRGLASEWMLDYVTITYKNEQNVAETKKFVANRWLDEKKGDKKTRIDLLPS